MNIRQVDDRDRLLAQLSEELDMNEASWYYARLVYVRFALAGLSGKSKPPINLWYRHSLNRAPTRCASGRAGSRS